MKVCHLVHSFVFVLDPKKKRESLPSFWEDLENLVNVAILGFC